MIDLATRPEMRELQELLNIISSKHDAEVTRIIGESKPVWNALIEDIEPDDEGQLARDASDIREHLHRLATEGGWFVW